MDKVNRAQIRAARALLDWTQPVLAAAAEIAPATLIRFETGLRTPIPTIKAAIVRALENEGIGFFNDGHRTGVFVSMQKLHATFGQDRSVSPSSKDTTKTPTVTAKKRRKSQRK